MGMKGNGGEGDMKGKKMGKGGGEFRGRETEAEEKEMKSSSLSFQLTTSSRSPPPSVFKSGASGWSCLRNRWTDVGVRVMTSRGLRTAASLLGRIESPL